MDNDSLEFQDISDKVGLLDGGDSQSSESASKSISGQRQSSPYNPENEAVDGEDQQVRVEDKKARIYELDFWQKFFDVDSREVAERLLRSFLPTKKNVFGDLLSAKPDFYGPFWSAVTLTFLLGLSTNIRSYFSQPEATNGTVSTAVVAESYQFEYNFQLVPAAIGLICGYFVMVGLIETLAIGCLHMTVRYGFATLVCAHGYSLVAFNLAAVCWLVSETWFAWIVTTVCTSLSVTPLLRTLLDSLEAAPEGQLQPSKTETKSQSETEIVVNVNLNDGTSESRPSPTTERLRRFAVPITIATVLVLHVTLAVSFMFVFYYQ